MKKNEMKKNVLAIGIMALLVCAVGLSVALASDNVTVPPAAKVSEISGSEGQSVELGSRVDAPINSVGGCDCVNDSATISLDETIVEHGSVCLDCVRPIGEKVSDDGTRATYSISGTLTPCEMHCYGPWYFSSGEDTTVSISWTPTSSSVDVGLRDSAGNFYYVTCTGGACSHTFHIVQGGNYHVCIRNSGASTINYNGYITI